MQILNVNTDRHVRSGASKSLAREDYVFNPRNERFKN